MWTRDRDMHIDSFVWFLTRYLKGRKGHNSPQRKTPPMVYSLISSPCHYYGCLLSLRICGIGGMIISYSRDSLVTWSQYSFLMLSKYWCDNLSEMIDMDDRSTLWLLEPKELCISVGFWPLIYSRLIDLRIGILLMVERTRDLLKSLSPCCGLHAPPDSSRPRRIERRVAADMGDLQTACRWSILRYIKFSL